MPSKQQKGKIIFFLDWLRQYLQDDPELKPWAKLIPLPGRHPISMYQRAIRDARARLVRDKQLAATNHLLYPFYVVASARAVPSHSHLASVTSICCVRQRNLQNSCSLGLLSNL
jgi:hypothetical protein